MVVEEHVAQCNSVVTAGFKGLWTGSSSVAQRGGGRRWGLDSAGGGEVILMHVCVCADWGG